MHGNNDQPASGYGDIKAITGSRKIVNIVSLEQSHHRPMRIKGTTIIHNHGFVMGLLQWHKINMLGEIHWTPVVALSKIWN